jgi:hypothetical protein
MVHGVNGTLMRDPDNFFENKRLSSIHRDGIPLAGMKAEGVRKGDELL